jgi:hypothetical protein
MDFEFQKSINPVILSRIYLLEVLSCGMFISYGKYNVVGKVCLIGISSPLLAPFPNPRLSTCI